MGVEAVTRYFETVAAHPHEPRLAEEVGTCRFDIEGAGIFSIHVDRGAVAVTRGEESSAPTCWIAVRSDDFDRLVRGEGHENLTTALLRGCLRFDGDLRFLAALQAILPMPAEWRDAP